MAFSWIHDALPCAAIVIDSAQTILAANSQAIELLCMDADEVGGIRLGSLLVTAGSASQSILQIPDGKHADVIDTLLLTAVRKRRYIRCLTRRTPSLEEELTFCLLFDVDRDERFRLMFSELPVGLYELDEDSRVIAVNKEILEMFAYENVDEMIGRPATAFYVHQEDEKQVAADAASSKGITGAVIQFIRADGKEFYGRLYSRLIVSGGRTLGRDGAILDVTEEEKHRRILKDVPLGFYTVGMDNSGDEIITECNEAFAHMFDFEEPQDVVGTKIATLYDSADDYDRFRRLIEERDRTNEPLIGEPVRVHSGKNRRFTIDVYCKPVHASREGGRIIGRIGLVRKTDEYEMRSLIKDIGRILHPYTGVLQMMQHTLSSAEETLVDTMDADDKPASRDQELKVMDGLVSRLQSGLKQVLDLRAEDGRAAAFPGEIWDRIELHRQQLLKYKTSIPFPELYPSSLRALGFTISQLVCDAGKGLPRELLRSVREAARFLQVAATRTEIQTTRSLVAEAGQQALTLREYIISRVTAPVRRTPENLDNLIRQAVEHNSGFASDQGVSIRRGGAYSDVEVLVARAAVIRALANLLHNAIKYSWPRRGGGKRWVEIRCFEKSGKAGVEFENFGVLIPEDEIQTGSIFVIGHRGRLSYETGRLGSGIGLADALAVARDHCGDIKITSIPVSLGSSEGKIGAKTTVGFHIPIQEEGFP